MIITLLYLLNLLKVYDKIFWYLKEKYTKDIEDDLFGFAERGAWDIAHFQAGIISILGLGLVGFIEMLLHSIIYSIIV